MRKTKIIKVLKGFNLMLTFLTKREVCAKLTIETYDLKTVLKNFGMA